jgi:hypothetical protein
MRQAASEQPRPPGRLLPHSVTRQHRMLAWQFACRNSCGNPWGFCGACLTNVHTCRSCCSLPCCAVPRCAVPRLCGQSSIVCWQFACSVPLTTPWGFSGALTNVRYTYRSCCSLPCRAVPCCAVLSQACAGGAQARPARAQPEWCYTAGVAAWLRG